MLLSSPGLHPEPGSKHQVDHLSKMSSKRHLKNFSQSESLIARSRSRGWMATCRKHSKSAWARYMRHVTCDLTQHSCAGKLETRGARPLLFLHEWVKEVSMQKGNVRRNALSPRRSSRSFTLQKMLFLSSFLHVDLLIYIFSPLNFKLFVGEEYTIFFSY